MTPTQAQDLKRLAEAATPGPWNVVWRTNAFAEIEAPNEAGYVAKKVAELSLSNSRPNSEYIAAMSPDVALQLLADMAMLLAALKDVAAAAEAVESGRYEDITIDYEDWLIKARAAIAQCEGTV